MTDNNININNNNSINDNENHGIVTSILFSCHRNNNNNNNNKNNETVVKENNNNKINNDNKFSSTGTSSTTTSTTTNHQYPTCTKQQQQYIDQYVGPIEIVHSTNVISNTNNNENSAGNNNTKKNKGRCLITTRNVQAGELLFITCPVLSVNVTTVQEQWLLQKQQQIQQQTQMKQQTVNEIAEQVLVDTCLSCTNTTIINSCLLLEGSTTIGTSTTPTPTPTVIPTIDALCCKDNNTNTNTTTVSNTNNVTNSDVWKQIIHQNAFGSDFLTFDTIEQRWNTEYYNNNHNDTNNVQLFHPGRMLSLYPLASMINHSCIPNAVRVFACCQSIPPNTNTDTDTDTENVAQTTIIQEYMIVHACTDIPIGNEIVWSYIPVIDHYIKRYKTIHTNTQHKFICTCQRCIAECTIWKTNDYIKLLTKRIDHIILDSSNSSSTSICNNNKENNNSNSINQDNKIILYEIIDLLENDLLLSSNTILSSSSVSKRYIRIGYLSIYMKYINIVLYECQQIQNQIQQLINTNNNTNTSHTNTDTNTTNDIPATIILLQNTIVNKKKKLLTICTQLHFSFVACHNASTEHLSILHLCYELISSIYTSTTMSLSSSSSVSNGNDNNTNKDDDDTTQALMKQVRFWTEQLKRTVQIRYGSLNNNVSTIRSVLHHTKLLLRTINGIDRVQYHFI